MRFNPKQASDLIVSILQHVRTDKEMRDVFNDERISIDDINYILKICNSVAFERSYGGNFTPEFFNGKDERFVWKLAPNIALQAAKRGGKEFFTQRQYVKNLLLNVGFKLEDAFVAEIVNCSRSAFKRLNRKRI